MDSPRIIIGDPLTWQGHLLSIDLVRKSIDLARESIDLERKSIDLAKKSIDLVKEFVDWGRNLPRNFFDYARNPSRFTKETH